jgi:hypothetical protein
MLVAASVACAGCAAVDAEEARPLEEARADFELAPPPPVWVEPPARVPQPVRCARAAAAWLPAAPEEAWRALWCCVEQGRFIALRELLGPDWDPLLRTRHDAPILLARVIAERGGDVEADLGLLHEHGIAIFSLPQALGRGAPGLVVMLRGKLSTSGIVEETRIASSWRANVDVATGRRLLATGADLLTDPDEPMVLFGRYDGLRDGDGWPELRVIAHFRPSALVTY